MLWVVAYLAVVSPLLMLFAPGMDNPPSWIYVAAVITALLAPVFLWMYMLGRPYRKFCRRTPHRTRRLETIAKHASAATRLPHRLAEREWRRRSWSKKTALHLPPGHLILLNAPPLDQKHPRPVPTSISFEPVDVSEDVERLHWIVQSNLEAQSGRLLEKEDETEAQPQTLRESLRSAHRIATSWANRIVPFVWLYLAWRRGGFLWWVAITWFTGTVLFGYVLPLFYEKRWWLVPGGLVHREAPLWRREPVVHLFTPRESALIMDVRTGSGLIRRGDRVRSLTCARGPWPVAAAWISRARTPSMEELLSLLGGS